MITRGKPQTSASTVPAHNATSAELALWHAALAWSSSAGWALIGPGGSISFAVEPDVDDFPDSALELRSFAVLVGPEVHPTNTRDMATRMAPMPQERDVCFKATS